MSAHRDLLERLYARFNLRDADAVLKHLRPDVVWPNGMDGGLVRGDAAVRHYWKRQWEAIDPTVEPIGFSEGADGRLAVIVHQVIRDLAGAVLKDTIVQHAYAFDGDLVQSMEISEALAEDAVDAATSSGITRAIHRFINCFDLKDWGTMRGLLTSELRTDYSQLRGEPPSMTTAEVFVESRATALASLATHHLMANLDIHVFGAAAAARASALIFRRRGSTAFDSHAVYNFALARRDRQWQIAGITQKIFWSEGEPGIHSGVSR